MRRKKAAEVVPKIKNAILTVLDKERQDILDGTGEWRGWTNEEKLGGNHCLSVLLKKMMEALDKEDDI